VEVRHGTFKVAKRLCRQGREQPGSSELFALCEWGNTAEPLLAVEVLEHGGVQGDREVIPSTTGLIPPQEHV
jgi:hypothetical protein